MTESLRDKRERELIVVLVEVFKREPCPYGELVEVLPYREFKTRRLLDQLIENNVVVAEGEGFARRYSVREL